MPHRNPDIATTKDWDGQKTFPLQHENKVGAQF